MLNGPKGTEISIKKFSSGKWTMWDIFRCWLLKKIAGKLIVLINVALPQSGPIPLYRDSKLCLHKCIIYPQSSLATFRLVDSDAPTD